MPSVCRRPCLNCFAVRTPVFRQRVTRVSPPPPPPVAAAEPGADAPLQLPYKALVSAVSSMAFSEGEAQRLVEILSDRAGVVHGTWHTVRGKETLVGRRRR